MRVQVNTITTLSREALDVLRERKSGTGRRLNIRERQVMRAPNAVHSRSGARGVSFAEDALATGKAAKEDLRDVLAMVRNTSNPQVEYMVRVISKWAASSGIKIS